MNRTTSSESPKIAKIYTDGACKGNPGPGGWGAILLWGKHRKEINGYHPRTTNNQMELTAIIKALEALKRPLSVVIFSDSSYVIKGMTEWLPGWKRRGWKRGKGVLLNAELWKRMDQLNQIHSIRWKWVKGHAGNPLNERADELANEAISQRKVY